MTYPPDSMRISAPGAPLTQALQQGGALSEMSARYAIQIIDMSTQQIMLAVFDPRTRQAVEQRLVCPPQAFQILYQLPQQAIVQLATGVWLLVDPSAPQLALATPERGRAWLGSQATPARAGPDPTDYPEQISLVSHGSDQFVPLKGVQFDAVALLYNGRRPPGVSLIGLRLDGFSLPVVLDGPQSPGAPILSEELKEQVIAPLLARVAQIPGAAGAVVDVRTGKVYAASLPTLLSAVSRQLLPKATPAVFQAVLPFIHPTLARAAANARAHAVSENPVHRGIATIGGMSSLLFTFFFLWLLYQMGVAPVYAVAREIPGLTLLDTPERALIFTLFGNLVVITVVRLLAWIPSWLEIMGVLFGADPTWQKILVWGALIDFGINWYYYFSQAVPDAALLFKQHGPLGGFGLFALHGLTSGGLAFISAWLWEALAAVSFVMALAFLPALGGAVGSMVRWCGLSIVRLGFGFNQIVEDVRAEAADQRARGRVVVVEYEDPSQIPH